MKGIIAMKYIATLNGKRYEVEIERINDFTPYQYNQVKGQPFVVSELVSQFEKLINSTEAPGKAKTYEEKVLSI